MIDRAPRSFEEVGVLDDAVARDLLARGDELERVWAIWALALRATDGAPELAAHTRGEPSAGVRRALAVVLAGHGHVDLVVALARHDPDEHVRASAMAIVVRFAEAGDVPWTIVGERLDRDAAAVRTAILANLGASAPPDLRARVAPHLADDDQDVRFEAFEALLRLRDAGVDEAAAMRAWLERAGPSERGHALHRWARLADRASIVRTLAPASSTVRRAAIESAPARGWSDIGPLVEHDAALFVAVRRLCTFTLDDVPLRLLVDAVCDLHAIVWDLLPEVRRRLDAGVPIEADVADRLATFAERCQTYVDFLREEELAYLAEDPDDPEPDPDAVSHRRSVEHLRDHARALATR